MRETNGVAEKYAGADARHAGRRHAFHHSGGDQRNTRRFALLNDFGTALDDPKQLSLAYQPCIQLASGSRCGVEVIKLRGGWLDQPASLREHADASG